MDPLRWMPYTPDTVNYTDLNSHERAQNHQINRLNILIRYPIYQPNPV